MSTPTDETPLVPAGRLTPARRKVLAAFPISTEE